ncbi:MAG: cupin domain-containing protein [Alphaproteobacteria bacterium]|nr:cupin domain-containing protein [Alphaproteobacteria bacterium]
MTMTSERDGLTEQDHLDAEAKVVKFSYKKPEDFDRPKISVRLGQTDVVRAQVQVIHQGGENNLHYHTKVDGMFTVLSGRIRFYGPGDEVIAECGPMEGVIIPRNARYWFDNVGEGDAEVMLVQGFHEAGAKLSGRTDSAPKKLADAGSMSGGYSAVVK